MLYEQMVHISQGGGWGGFAARPKHSNAAHVYICQGSNALLGSGNRPPPPPRPFVSGVHHPPAVLPIAIGSGVFAFCEHAV